MNVLQWLHDLTVHCHFSFLSLTFFNPIYSSHSVGESVYLSVLVSVSLSLFVSIWLCLLSVCLSVSVSVSGSVSVSLCLSHCLSFSVFIMNRKTHCYLRCSQIIHIWKLILGSNNNVFTKIHSISKRKKKSYVLFIHAVKEMV